MQDKAILLDKAADIAIIFKIRRVSLEHLSFFLCCLRRRRELYVFHIE